MPRLAWMLARPWWDGRGPAELAHQMALLPLVWLCVLRYRGRKSEEQWWWMATAFAISWLADATVDVAGSRAGWAVSLVYPVAQSILIAAALVRRFYAAVMLVGLVGLSLIVAFGTVIAQPDIVFHAAAWLLVVGIVIARPALPSRLRLALAVYFGIGLVAWAVHVRWLTVATWYPYQTARLAGLLLFCWAATKPGPSLKAVT